MPSTENSARAGRFVEQQSGPDGFSAFVPSALPPDPPPVLDEGLQARMDRANQALGRLDGITLLLPNPEEFLYSYVRKEAVLSSQIEGTQSSLSDLLLFEHDGASGVTRGDAQEASNYVSATYRGIEMLEDEGLPLSNRVLKEAHRVLLTGARGGDREPGEFRRSQNWIGGTRPGTARFVPPPASEVPAAMDALEKFLHGVPVQTPVLVKAALAHAQFETIHPFLDGNGRVGRLLITLLLVSEGVLDRPLLYPSLYLKQHREVYYEHLQRIRTDGAWEEWIGFFLDGIAASAESTIATTKEIVRLVETDRQRIQTLGRSANTASLVHDDLVKFVIGRPSEIAESIGMSEPPVYQALEHLERLGIARETTGRRRGRIYAYDRYLELLNEDTTTPYS